MTKRVPRQSANDFSELERAFFEAAPPEGPVVMAEPLRFDDLEDPIDERARPERRRRPRRERRPRPVAVQPRSPLAVRLGEAWRLSRTATAQAWRLSRVATARAWRLSHAATARAWRLSHAATSRALYLSRTAVARRSRQAWSLALEWTGPRAERARQRLVASLVLARASVLRRVRVSLERLGNDLPGERLQGKTFAAMVAVTVFVVIAAGVVARRPALSAPRADTTTSLAP